jgi:hypothetical protein
MKEVIDALRREMFKVTMHDMAKGDDEVMFRLAVRFNEPVDLYYLGRALSGVDLGLAAQTEDGVIYFPEIYVDAETYGYILETRPE